MSNWSNGLRIAALAATLLAGSCASDDGKFSSDGAENHPIVVEPRDESLKLPFSAPEAGLLPEDAARLEAFVNNYLSQGDGALSISAPQGPDSSAAIAYFGERLAQLGVPRSHILVGTHDTANGDAHVELNFISYSARTDQCGDWSENLAKTGANDTSPNFGCAVQQNIAAMVANPHDLLVPQPETPDNATRRAVVLDHYEKGEVTAATKSKDQSGSVADAGGSGGSGK